MASMTDQVKATASESDSGHRTEYLGDGLYAGMDGDMICLSCDREDGEHIVFMDFAVYRSLVRYATEMGFIL